VTKLVDELSAHRRLLVTAYFIALLAATLAPVPDVAYPPSDYDKPVHVILFAGLGFLLHWYLSWRSGRSGVLVPFTLTLGVAALIEVVQGVLPFRNADEWDFVAGAAGAVVGVAASYVVRRVKQREIGADDSTF
jgi:VanZ family protein